MKYFFYILAIGICFCDCAVAADDFVEGDVIVTFQPQLSEIQQDAVLAQQKLRAGKRFSRFVARGRGSVCLVREASRSTAQMMAALKGRKEVVSVEPNYIRHFTRIAPNDTHFSQLWGLENKAQSVNSVVGTEGVDTKFTTAWRLAKATTNEIVIGVIDSGMDIDHPDIRPNLWTNLEEIPWDGIDNDGNGRIDDLHGFDFAGNTPRMTDSGEHGTHVAATAAAAGRNGRGVIGVDFHAKVIALKASTNGITILTSATLAAYDYALALKQRGVNIVALNASFGGPSFSTAERNAIIALRDVGIVLCAASGNDGTDNDVTPFYPASYDVSNIIAVAALTSQNQLSNFSNIGATSVDLAAPGSNIYSAGPLANFPVTTSVTVGSTTYEAQVLSGAGYVTSPGVTANVIRCGIGNPLDFPLGIQGNIALIQRGTITFAEKVANAMKAGAVAAIIDDNTASDLTVGAWQLNTLQNFIPAVRVTQASGEAIINQLPSSGTVQNGPGVDAPYKFLNGTSMACPHVAGAVAFAARNFPNETMPQRIARILDNSTPVAALNGKMTIPARLNLLKMIDTDEDQLPDWWEMEHWANLAATANDNPDMDSFSNLDEFLSGTSPVQAGSQLAFSRAAVGEGNVFRLAFPSVMDTRYKVEQSSDLTTWSTLLSPIAGTGSEIELTDPLSVSGNSRNFYRISLLPSE
jgi:subtilisin family serine protease